MRLFLHIRVKNNKQELKTFCNWHIFLSDELAADIPVLEKFMMPHIDGFLEKHPEFSFVAARYHVMADNKTDVLILERDLKYKPTP